MLVRTRNELGGELLGCDNESIGEGRTYTRIQRCRRTGLDSKEPNGLGHVQHLDKNVSIWSIDLTPFLNLPASFQPVAGQGIPVARHQKRM
jgi:hypothetical protein